MAARSTTTACSDRAGALPVAARPPARNGMTVAAMSVKPNSRAADRRAAGISTAGAVMPPFCPVPATPGKGERLPSQPAPRFGRYVACIAQEVVKKLAAEGDGGGRLIGVRRGAG